MGSEFFRLTATEVLKKTKSGELSVQDYANSLLERIKARDEAVQAWAYLDPAYVIEQAKALDALPESDRGPLHGVAIAVKDVIFTKGWLIRSNNSFEIRSSTCQTCRHNSIRLCTPTMLPKSMPDPS